MKFSYTNDESLGMVTGLKLFLVKNCDGIILSIAGEPIYFVSAQQSSNNPLPVRFLVLFLPQIQSDSNERSSQ